MTTAHIRSRSAAIGVALCFVAIYSISSLIQQSVEPPAEWDGLVRLKRIQLDHVYSLCGATLAGYQRVRLGPVEVAFDKNWEPNSGGTTLSRRLSNDDLDKIKSTLASEFRLVFAPNSAKAASLSRMRTATTYCV
jgi:hypothetical protein